jgi:hypothetical protein
MTRKEMVDALINRVYDWDSGEWLDFCINTIEEGLENMTNAEVEAEYNAVLGEE